jgi:hypothetical protein
MIALLLAVLGGASVVILRFLFPPTITTTFISRTQFTFPNAEKGRYPNGLRFTINEILDPAILDLTYNQLELARFGVERNQFHAGFSIRPFASTELEIADQVRQQLADRRLSFAERDRLEQQLKSQLEKASRGAAELAFTMISQQELPSEVGRAVMQLVPRTWAQAAIDKKGVLRIRGFSGVEILIPKETIDQQSLPSAIFALTEASLRLDDRLSQLRNAPSMWMVRDQISGKSFRDLERDIRDLQLLQINPLRAALTTYTFPKSGGELKVILQQRISDLDILQKQTAKQAETVAESLNRFVDATAGLTRKVAERRGGDQGVAGGTVVPQVSEGFVDRIVALTLQGYDAKENQAFITRMTEDQFELDQRLIAYQAEQNRWKELLAALPTADTSAKEPDDATRDRMIKQMRRAIDEINANWAALSRLEAEFAANRMSRTAELYVPLVVERDVIRHDAVSLRRLLALVMAVVAIVFLTLWATLAASVLRREGLGSS